MSLFLNLGSYFFWWGGPWDMSILFLHIIFTEFIGIFITFFPYIMVNNFGYQATGHTFVIRNAIFDFRDSYGIALVKLLIFNLSMVINMISLACASFQVNFYYNYHENKYKVSLGKKWSMYFSQFSAKYFLFWTFW